MMLKGETLHDVLLAELIDSPQELIWKLILHNIFI